MAHVVGLVAAFVVLWMMGRPGVALTAGSALFVVFSIGFTVAMLALVGRDSPFAN